MTKNNTYNIAIVGATGAVGQKILKILADKNFPINDLKLLSSPRSAGKKIDFKGETLTVEVAEADSFKNVDVALFSAGGSISKKLAPEAVKRSEEHTSELQSRGH